MDKGTQIEIQLEPDNIARMVSCNLIQTT
jgi:hypothetical protein